MLSGRSLHPAESLVQRIPTECGVSVCDREASIMRRHWPTRSCCAMIIKNLICKYSQVECYCESRLKGDLYWR